MEIMVKNGVINEIMQKVNQSINIENVFKCYELLNKCWDNWVSDPLVYSYSAKWFAAIEEIVVVCGQQEVWVETKDNKSWPKGESEAKGPVFGGELISNPKSDSSDQEV